MKDMIRFWLLSFLWFFYNKKERKPWKDFVSANRRRHVHVYDGEKHHHGRITLQRCSHPGCNMWDDVAI